MKSSRKSKNPLTIAFILVTAGLIAFQQSYILQNNPSSDSGRNGVVSSENELCSKIGVEILKTGGNGIDSVIATTLCIGVTNFQSSGLGGGGFLVYRKNNGESVSINFREKAPALASTDMFVNDTSKAAIGGLSIAVPGELMGLYEAYKRFIMSHKDMAAWNGKIL